MATSGLTPLTPEQRKFAEEYHDTVYIFMRRYRLDFDEYYDIVIFGYLKAVQNYLTNDSLRHYSFPTIARWTMRSYVDMETRKVARYRDKIGTVLRLDEPTGEDGSPLHSVIADHSDEYSDVLAQIQATSILAKCEAPERELMILKVNGYTPRELANMYGVHISTVYNWISRTRNHLMENIKTMES